MPVNKDRQSRSATPCCPGPNVSTGGGVGRSPTPVDAVRAEGQPTGGQGQDQSSTLPPVGPLAESSGSRRSARRPTRTVRPAAGPPLAGASPRPGARSSSRLACAARRGLPRLPGRGMPSRAVLGQLGRQSGHEPRGSVHPGRAPVHHDRVGTGRPTRPTRSWSPAYARARLRSAPAIARAKPRSSSRPEAEGGSVDSPVSTQGGTRARCHPLPWEWQRGCRR